MSRFLKILMVVTSIIFFMVVIGELFISNCFPQYTFKGHLAIPLYFWLLYLLAAMFVQAPMTAVEYTKFLIGFKALKMFVSMVFITALAFFMREQVVAIVFNFIIYYLLLLVPECLYSIYIKKHIKK
ncbi:MAG: hypothetical protein IJ436_07250 [Bacteroidaceae bacterium]|nr:hypothetical protein [Bacteroidaceae bacterium]